MSENAGRRSRFIRAFLSSALGTALSRVFGAARDIVTASVLGASAASDAFYVAWTIPNVFRRFVADEGLTGALIPALAQAEREEDPETVHQLSASVLGALLLLNVLFIGLGVLGADVLVLMFAWSWKDDPEQYALVVAMTRWLFPFLGMVSLVSFFEGLLNYRGHFLVPKLAPALVSLGIVLGAVTVGTSLEQPVWGLVGGVLVGGAAHVLIHFPVLARRWGRIRVSFRFQDPRLRAVLWELGKVIVIGVFAQLNLLVLRQLATSLPSGSVSYYWNANRVVDLSQGIVAVAIGSALLPNVAKAVADQDWGAFRSDLVRALRLAAFLLLPVAATLLAFAVPITAVLFRHGEYTVSDMETTASTLRYMVPFVLAVAGINIIKKVYFALDDRMTLLAVGMVGVLLTGGTGLALIRPLGVEGLALALSVATLVQLSLYVLVLRRRLGTHLGLGALGRPLLQIMLAMVPVVITLVPAVRLGDWDEGPTLRNLVVLCGALGVAALGYLGVSWAVGLPEVRMVVDRLRKRAGR